MSAQRGETSLQVELADADQRPVRVGCGRMPTVLGLVADAHAPRERLPGAWYDVVAHAVTAPTRGPVAPVVDPRTPAAPNCLVPLCASPHASLEDDFDQILEDAANVLPREIEQEFGADVPEHWRPGAPTRAVDTALRRGAATHRHRHVRVAPAGGRSAGPRGRARGSRHRRRRAA